MRPVVLVLTCAVILNVRSAQSVDLVGKENQRIYGKCTFLVEDVATLDGCMCYLKDRANVIEAVSFDVSSAVCFAAPRDGQFTIVHAADWITYVMVYNKSSGSQIFTTSTTWNVPAWVNSFTGLCIGGGGGSIGGNNGGGASGFIAYGTVTVSYGAQIAITIGGGGAGSANSSASAGGSSSIGSYIVAAGGGQATTSRNGGSGGSGGGGGACCFGSVAGNGGYGGAGGGNGPNYAGGSGQGTAVWTAAAQSLSTVTVTFGSAGVAVNPITNANAGGGGGGGGIIVNGGYVTAGTGSATGGAGTGGTGYGAGAGGGGCNTVNGVATCSSTGGSGAQGICIVEW